MKIFYGWRIVGAGGALQFLQSLLLNQAFGAYLAVERIFFGLQPSSGTVMLSVLPLLLGVQLLLTAIVMDVNNENRK